MRLLAFLVSTAVVLAPLSASADRRGYAHRHVQPQYHQPYQQPRHQQGGLTAGHVLGGLVILGLLAGARDFDRKHDGFRRIERDRGGDAPRVRGGGGGGIPSWCYEVGRPSRYDACR